ncbi:phage holin family protein [Corynebacterium freiburgense]|uniref:phage holin family protein n=1 Tax=Corynebacterium freiburgense TaxID=556548 RepID=UPI000416B7B6|nr:phage holin family protein [Corynebacterium freiburgense]WJZ01476.1 hypothetical protein CFREI_00835 [Corynebacterium freiburgense]
MSNKSGLYTDGTESFSPRVNEIPLSDADSRSGSLGTLVSDATAQMSNLFRAELELAKAEITQEAKKGAVGGGLFGVAGTVALYSSFFFFFFLAELLDLWLHRWAAFLIVFLFMLVIAAVLALIGFKKIKKIGPPKKTIESVNDLKELVSGDSQKKLESRGSGMYS